MKRVDRSDLFWAYLSQILYSGLNIIILPVVLNKLDSAEIGLWYTFSAVGAVVSMLDFGFLSTILRNFTYAWNGADWINKEGVIENKNAITPNIELFAYVFKATRLIYFVIGIAALVLTSTVGTAYLYSLPEEGILIGSYIPAWMCYSIAIFINIYYSYWTPVLRSVGGIKQSYQITTVSKVVQMILSIIGLLLGYGLFAVAFAYLVSNLSTRILSRYAFSRIDEIRQHKSMIDSIKIKKTTFFSLLRNMWPNAWKQGVVVLSKFFQGKASILLSSSFLGLTASAMFGLTLQIFEIITTVANVMINVYAPTMGKYYVEGSKTKLYDTFTMIYGSQFLLTSIAGIFVVFFGDPLLVLIKSNSSLISTIPLLTLLFYTVLTNSMIIADSFIALGNRVPMYKSRIISSLIAIILQFILAVTVPSIGIWFIIIPSLIVLLSYNAWRWILYIANYFRVTFVQIHVDSVKGVGRLVRGIFS